MNFRLPLLWGLILVGSAHAQDKGRDQESSDKIYRHFDRPYDLWRTGKTLESEKSEKDSIRSSTRPIGPILIRESIWAEPIKLPDGRYSLYVPPGPVLEFLENPTKKTARAYLAWQEERTRKMKKAIRLLEVVKRKLAAEREAARKKVEDTKTGPFTITYFHSDT